MVDVLRQQLAELMEEELGEEKKPSGVSFTHHTVCKPYLLECCPYDLLLNTKIDRGGGCKETHDPKLKKEYEEAREKEGKDIWHIDEDVTRVLRKYVYDCDTRIREMELQQKKESLNDVDNEKVIEISTQIDDIEKKAESLGEEGKIEESIQLIKQADHLKKLREEVRASLKTNAPTSHLMKFRVCEICGASLVKENMDSRLADHFAGRLHNGYRVMREKMAWIENERKRVQDEERERRRGKDVERDRERGKERDREVERERERRYNTDRHRSEGHGHSHSHAHSHSHSHREKERSEDRHKHRDKGRDFYRSRYEDSSKEDEDNGEGEDGDGDGDTKKKHHHKHREDEDEEDGVSKKKRKRDKEKKNDDRSSEERSTKDDRKKRKRKKDDDDD